jgi:AcrR family transcriptional regulator
MTSGAVPLDRRHRRRLETIEEVLDHAVAIMAEDGVAGLSLGEIARRMGIRPPSLYVYFDSKNALYDALFHRGAQAVLEAFHAADVLSVKDGMSLEEQLLDAARFFVRWTVEHPAYTQLLFWRPVPGFTPSEASYAPAVELVRLGKQRFAELQRHGLIRADVDIEDVQRDWTIVTAGITSQQLSNAPDEPFDSGTFTTRLPSVVAMFARHYAAPTSSAPTRRARHGNTRRADR